MFFSRHNEHVILSGYFPGPYTLYGDVLAVGVTYDCKRRQALCMEDILTSHCNPKEYKTLVIEKDICRIEPGVIELFSNLKDLIVEADLKKIECTPELEALLKKNDVVLRGRFNSPAEKLAKRLDLRFIHKNIFLALVHYEEHHESVDLTLCFQKDEPPFLWRDYKCPGISAGNTGGGTVRDDLPEDFYAGCDAARFADEFVGVVFEEQVRNNKELDAFLKEANRRLNGKKATNKQLYR